MPPRTRDDQSYVIDAALNTLKVLEALQGNQYEPVKVPEVQKRTGFTYDFCRRALRTLKAAGWAVETERGWQLSVKAAQFSEKFTAWAITLPGNPLKFVISELSDNGSLDSKELTAKPNSDLRIENL